MCGIAAFISFDSGAISDIHRNSMNRVVEMMRERGPDSSGIFAKDNVILGHTRLAIIDLTAGQQPFADPSGSRILVYNGEIFNFREIRSELVKKGHTFKTDCDTEVVLASYLEWGEDCLSHFNGFFAFAIADFAERRIFAARDRLGLKPLIYARNNAGFALASTTPSVITLLEMSPAPDLEAVSHYISTGRTNFGHKTLVRDVFSLPPAHKLSISMDDASSLKTSRWWSRPIMSKAEKQAAAVPFEKAVEQTRALIDESVKLRLMSDVPLGAFLSGGLDSAIITHCASKHSTKSVPCFCAGTDEESMNEFNYAQMMSDKLGMPLQKITVDSARFSADWDKLIASKGLPLSTPNEVSIYHLAKALSEKCKVTLTGEGADEIFGGYVQPQFSAYDLERQLERASVNQYEFENSPFAMSLILLYGRANFIDDTDHYLATSTWLSYTERASLFREDTWDSIGQDGPVFEFYADFFDKLDKCSIFDRRMHLFAEFNLESLLFRIDNSTMAASVEARVPFTDYRLSELAFTMPDEYKMWWKDSESMEKGANLIASAIDAKDLITTKRLPRTAFSDVIPDEIIKRKKMSFPVPFAKWLSGPLLKQTVDMCLDSKFARDTFDRKTLEAMLANPTRNIWVIANLCKWADSTLK